ncbi:hypothetical protein [Glutamicibacter arilaitensis]|uniref:hypothetical protein n=1 Tax=Glutamicibacter arilaitensis TaxID=256701 RepID=UPI003F8F8134
MHSTDETNCAQEQKRFDLNIAELMVAEQSESAEWLREQRRELRLGVLEIRKREYLDENMPGWDSVELDQAFGI